MLEQYQIYITISKNDPQYEMWEKLNFVLRRIFEILNSIVGDNVITFRSSIDMSGEQITGGPKQLSIDDDDYVTKSYFKSSEFGSLITSLISGTGKVPLPMQNLPGSSGGGGGGGGTNDHAALIHLSYSESGHTGFTPSTRQISTTAPLSGGGDLSADRTLSISKADSSTDGYLSSTDWTTFSQKVSVSSGAAGKIAKFSGTDSITQSVIAEKDGLIGIGLSVDPSYNLEVGGSIKATDGSFLPQVKTLSISSGLVSTDASIGNHFRISATSDFTLSNPTNASDGQRIIWEITQDSTGGREITLGDKFIIPDNVPDVILSTTPLVTDMISVIYNSSKDSFIVTGFIKEY